MPDYEIAIPHGRGPTVERHENGTITVYGRTYRQVMPGVWGMEDGPGGTMLNDLLNALDAALAEGERARDCAKGSADIMIRVRDERDRLRREIQSAAILMSVLVARLGGKQTITRKDYESATCLVRHDDPATGDITLEAS